MEKIILTAFTDPMMGLSYESEPIMERLAAEYGDTIEFRNVMCLLVRDVADFMTPDERAMEPAAGIERYCERLAGIYKEEERLGGLPVNMDGFCLFDEQHRRSKPLNLAYEAALLADPEKASAFLVSLRHATVRDCRPTTRYDEISRVVREVGIDEEAFARRYADGSAEAALNSDLAFARKLGVFSLPAYLIERDGNALLMQSFRYEDFAVAIAQLES